MIRYLFVAETTMPNHRNRTIQFLFDGGNNPRLNAEIELRKRLRQGRSEYKWYGVGYSIFGPLVVSQTSNSFAQNGVIETSERGLHLQEVYTVSK